MAMMRLGQFQSRCWLELRCNDVFPACVADSCWFQSRCWLELRCNTTPVDIYYETEEFQSRCWLELRCNLKWLALMPASFISFRADAGLS